MSWTAKYDGTCGRCLHRIHADEDEVHWLDPSEVVDGRAVAHVSCPEPVDPLAIPPQGVCPTCHLTLPATGICGSC